MQEKKRKEEVFFVVTYRDAVNGKIVSLKARTIRDSSLGLSFIEISDFIFDIDGPVLNPVEEELSRRYQGVKKQHLTIYSIISIEEMGDGHRGLQFDKDKSKLLVLTSNQPV